MYWVITILSVSYTRGTEISLQKDTCFHNATRHPILTASMDKQDEHYSFKQKTNQPIHDFVLMFSFFVILFKIGVPNTQS